MDECIQPLALQKIPVVIIYQTCLTQHPFIVEQQSVKHLTQLLRSSTGPKSTHSCLCCRIYSSHNQVYFCCSCGCLYRHHQSKRSCRENSNGRVRCPPFPAETISHISSRVSIVDYRGGAILDTYVRPTLVFLTFSDFNHANISRRHRIEDYRTSETGIQYHHLVNGLYMVCICLANISTYRTVVVAPHFQDVQYQVANIIKNKVIVGYSLWNFLSVRSCGALFKYYPYLPLNAQGTRSLTFGVTNPRSCFVSTASQKAEKQIHH